VALHLQHRQVASQACFAACCQQYLAAACLLLPLLLQHLDLLLLIDLHLRWHLRQLQLRLGVTCWCCGESGGQHSWHAPTRHHWSGQWQLQALQQQQQQQQQQQPRQQQQQQW
jgi:hypothetical protein